MTHICSYSTTEAEAGGLEVCSNEVDQGPLSILPFPCSCSLGTTHGGEKGRLPLSRVGCASLCDFSELAPRVTLTMKTQTGAFSL